MTLAERLERALYDHEVRLEAVLLGRLAARPTVESYRRYLCDVYGVVEPYEKQLVASSDLELAFLQPRIRSGYMALDLMALGLTQTEYQLLARRFEVPRLDSRIDALAWTYVVERLAHTNAALFEQLKMYLPNEMRVASRYLAADYSHNARALGACIDAHTFCDVDRVNIVATAATLTERICEWAAFEGDDRVLVQPQANAS